MTRSLSDEETADLLASDTVARLATIDASGYPHVTPLWFLWAEGAFHLASDAGRPHLARLHANPRVGSAPNPRRSPRRAGDQSPAPPWPRVPAAVPQSGGSG
jgi:hypothetical protein